MADPVPASETPTEQKHSFDPNVTGNILARQSPEDIDATLAIMMTRNPEFAKRAMTPEPAKPTPAPDPPKVETPAVVPTPAPAPTPLAPATPVKDDPIAAMQAELHTMKIDNARLAAIQDFPGLDKTDIALLAGNTPEEVYASAKLLSERYASKIPAPAPVVDPATGQPAPAPAAKPAPRYPNDTPLPPPPSGPVTVNEFARMYQTPEGREKIKAELRAEGNKLVDAGFLEVNRGG